RHRLLRPISPSRVAGLLSARSLAAGKFGPRFLTPRFPREPYSPAARKAPLIERCLALHQDVRPLPRSRTILAAALILERDVELRPVDHLAVVERHVELSHLGDAKVAQAL